MVDESFVNGTVKDHHSKPKEKVIVEAYHVASSLIFPVQTRYYLGKSEETKQDGKFEISFPTNAYGVINGLIRPNIELRVVDQYQLLYTNEIRYMVTDKRNYFGLEIPKLKEIYSDKIDHVDWSKLVTNFLEDVSKKPLKEIEGKLAVFLVPIEEMKYTKQKVQDLLGYKDLLHTSTDPTVRLLEPKTKQHDHEIPWEDTENV